MILRHTATVITDPFEQAFFALVHLAYLQGFEDVNKRVSRLAANIPLIRGNLCPLSFVDDGDGSAGGSAARLCEEVAQDPAPCAGDRPREDEVGDDMTKLKELKSRFMQDPEFREEYARVDEEYALIEALVRARAAAKLTQAELAKRLGTTQSAVARLEGGWVSPSFVTLRRYAEATGTRLTVRLVPADG